VSGALPWSKVRVITRCATPANEGGFIERGRQCSVQVLEKELRAVERGSLLAAASRVKAALADPTTESVAVRLPLRTAFKWQRTRRYAARVAGEKLPAASVLEWVTAEVGRAPGELWFELGTREGKPPLVRYRSGDRVA